MFLARRVAIRATILANNWMHRNAFALGILAGVTLTLGVLLFH